MNETIRIQLNDVSFQLKEDHDFDLLQDMGTVFQVFDQQDSGNISSLGLQLMK